MPVEIPDYLNRPEIMTRKGRNTVELAEFNRWAGSFKESITAVLAENLGLLLGSDLVYVPPLRHQGS
ncbi:PqiC family protein [Desulfocastanea catecholica]